jgi:hypothetical protein
MMDNNPVDNVAQVPGATPGIAPGQGGAPSGLQMNTPDALAGMSDDSPGGIISPFADARTLDVQPKLGYMDSLKNTLKGIPGQISSYAGEHPIKATLGALSVINALSGSKRPSAPKLPKGWNDPLPQYNWKRQQTTPRNDNYFTYGQMPEDVFFDDNAVSNDAFPIAQPGHYRGGFTLANGGALQDTRTEHYVHGGTGASGRADNIDAKLSENEYVMDAESVAMLGDGNPEAGARKLDQMRSNLRRHKGKALARGKFTPAAKDPHDYMTMGAR